MPDHTKTAITAKRPSHDRPGLQAPIGMTEGVGVLLLIAMAAQVITAVAWAVDVVDVAAWVALHIAISVVAGIAITAIMARDLLAAAKARTRHTTQRP